LLLKSGVIKIRPAMSKSNRSSPVCIVIAGPNGAGKTTFAREYLLTETRVFHFVNPDLIASGLSPLRPELAELAAGRLFLQEIDRLARAGTDFAFESTLRANLCRQAQALESCGLPRRGRLLAPFLPKTRSSAHRRPR
jgi:hypothetical protein